jgi:uncharacterized HAD superfamily protein
VDVDDVLACTTEGLVQLVRTRHGRDVQLEDVHDFDLRVSFDLSEAEHDAFLDAAHTSDFLEQLAEFPGCRRVVGHWSESGYAIHVVTGRPPSALEATQRWLATQQIPHDVVTCVDKYGRHGEAPGSQSLSSLASSSYALVVEDSADMARFFAEETGASVALMDRPWNRSAGPLPKRITRVRSWDDILRRFPRP